MPAGVHKNPQSAIRIPKPTMDKLKYIAAYYGRSMNKEVEQLILRHIARFEKKVGPIFLEEFTPKTKSESKK
ncbi:MAG: Arc family DNA-binding protein [Firmicutes bacterium]|nr:Arc family DNA-binding protein [Bacillota bacterium]